MRHRQEGRAQMAHGCEWYAGGVPYTVHACIVWGQGMSSVHGLLRTLLFSQC